VPDHDVSGVPAPAVAGGLHQPDAVRVPRSVEQLPRRRLLDELAALQYGDADSSATAAGSCVISANDRSPVTY
jgi:hypothetical protein